MSKSKLAEARKIYSGRGFLRTHIEREEARLMELEKMESELLSVVG